MGQFIVSAFADEIDMDLKTQMDVLDTHEIKFIEMRGVNGKNVADLTLEEAKEIKKQLEIRGFQVSAIGSPIGKIGIEDPFEAELDKFKHTLEIAKILDTCYIRMFSFFIPEDKNPEDYFEEVIRRWRAYIEAAVGAGVLLLHENEKNIYGDTAKRCLKLIETLNCDFVKLTFDPANFIQVGQDTIEAYELLKDYIAYIHIKDADQEGNVVPAGYGIGNVKVILDNLKHREYEGFLSLEPHLGQFQGLENFELDDRYQKLPPSGAKTFAVAAAALKELMK